MDQPTWQCSQGWVVVGRLPNEKGEPKEDPVGISAEEWNFYPLFFFPDREDAEALMRAIKNSPSTVPDGIPFSIRMAELSFISDEGPSDSS